MTALGLALWALFYLALTWLVWTAGRVSGEWLIGIQRIRSGDIDRQLIRLAARLLSLILSIAILIEGANRLGLPAYSVLAGLGIGGLAAALAGQQTLANLFGSLIIMIEKPFRVGHKIRTAHLEGFVEDVGFRSTRLRTPDHTLVTVPSSDLINHTIENLSQRRYWRVFERLHLVTDVPVGHLQSFVGAVWAKVFHRADVARDDFRVLLSGIGLYGYEVLLDFSIQARSETRFLRKRHVLLLRIASLADTHGVRFERVTAGEAPNDVPKPEPGFARASEG
jgi:MscS family membrane protein